MSWPRSTEVTFECDKSLELFTPRNVCLNHCTSSSDGLKGPMKASDVLFGLLAFTWVEREHVGRNEDSARWGGGAEDGGDDLVF